MNDIDRSNAKRRLGFTLYALAWALGVAELGIMSRAGEWLRYGEIGTLGFVYFVALLVGVLLAPRLPLRDANVIGISVVLAAVPICTIGWLLVAGFFESEDRFAVACLLWACSGVGAGMLDNAQSAQAVGYSTRGRTDSVAMLGVRHLGTLAASSATALAVTVGIGVGWQYAVLGVILLLPVAARRYVPDTPKATVETAAPGARTGPAWILVLMGGYAAAAVLPISAGWAWINPVMRELHASGALGALALPGFVIAQATACLVYFRRSENRSVRDLVLQGVSIAALGVAALTLAILLPAGTSEVLAVVGFAMLGWGIGPLPMVVAQAVQALPLKLPITARLARTVAVQCVLVAGGNLAVGRSAERWTGLGTFTGVGALCVAVLFAGVPLVSGNRPKPASA